MATDYQLFRTTESQCKSMGLLPSLPSITMSVCIPAFLCYNKGKCTQAPLWHNTTYPMLLCNHHTHRHPPCQYQADTVSRLQQPSILKPNYKVFPTWDFFYYWGGAPSPPHPPNRMRRIEVMKRVWAEKSSRPGLKFFCGLQPVT